MPNEPLKKTKKLNNNYYNVNFRVEVLFVFSLVVVVAVKEATRRTVVGYFWLKVGSLFDERRISFRVGLLFVIELFDVAYK